MNMQLFVYKDEVLILELFFPKGITGWSERRCYQGLKKGEMHIDPLGYQGHSLGSMSIVLPPTKLTGYNLAI